MGKKGSTSSSLSFEESDQHDSLMEQIFDGISDVPDKEPGFFEKKTIIIQNCSET